MVNMVIKIPRLYENMFSNVYAIENRGVGIANWNIEQYDYHFNEGFLIHQGRRWPIVFFIIMV